MNFILLCNFIVLLSLMPAKAQMTFADVYNGFLTIEYELEKVCIKENNLSEAMVAAMVENISKNGIFPDKRDYQCFFHCMLLKSKITNEKGEILFENLKEIAKDVHTGVLENFMTDCANKVNEKDPCERATSIQKCFFEEFKLIGKD